MEKNRRKVIRAGITQVAKNPEFVARGASPPKAGSPCSVSPTAENCLSTFLQIDAGGFESSGASPVSLSEFISKKKPSRRRPPKAAPAPSRDVIRDENLDVGVESEFQDSEHSTSRDSSENHSDDPAKEQGGEDSNVGDSLVSKLLRQLNDLSEPASVPEDEISRNKQEQDDEIVALEAIYEGAFRALHDNCFLVEVSMELAAETIEVSLEQASTSSSSTPGYTFTLEFLPPIRLGFAFPRTYPSRSPPVFVLESEWIPAEKLVLLGEHLTRTWEEQSGEVVVYPWSEFLHSQALGFLGASERLVLERSTSCQLDHPRVISGAKSQQITAATLLAYDEEMREKLFTSSLHLCNICFTEYVGKEFIRLPCKHLFCESCMKKLASVQVAEGTLSRLVCPSCPEAIPPFLLKRLLGVEEFEKWEKMMLQKSLDSMMDVVYCPRCDTPCIKDSTDHHTQCQKCFFSFCGVCDKNWHAGRKCMSALEQLKQLEERAAVAGYKTADQRIQEENLKNELKNMELIQRESKPCPTCNMAISKSEGCNKMVCSNCWTFFCYNCGKCITGYEHFRDGRCELVTVQDNPEDHAIWQEILRNEERLRHQRTERGQEMLHRHQQMIRNEEAVAAFPERVRACPACGKKNAKINNNNHILCNSCQIHYCGVCLKVVRRATEHFGASSKCKQHSEDLKAVIDE